MMYEENPVRAVCTVKVQPCRIAVMFVLYETRVYELYWKYQTNRNFQKSESADSATTRAPVWYIYYISTSQVSYNQQKETTLEVHSGQFNFLQ